MNGRWPARKKDSRAAKENIVARQAKSFSQRCRHHQWRAGMNQLIRLHDMVNTALGSVTSSGTNLRGRHSLSGFVQRQFVSGSPGDNHECHD